MAGPFTADDQRVNRARELARSYMSEHNISQAQMSAKLGVAPSTFNEFLKGVYCGRSSDIATKVAEFTGVQEDQARFVPIRNYKRVHEVLRRTKAQGEFAVIVGDPGLGKTTAVKAWVQQDEDAVYVRIDGAMGKGDLLTILARRLGQLPRGHNLTRNLQSVIYALQEQPRLIIIDEADRLTIPKLELVRDIYDSGNCSMVLIGLERFLLILKHGHSQKENLAQLYSRVGYLRKLDQLDPGDVRLVLEHERIRKIKDETVQMIVDRIRSGGGMRTLVKVIVRAKEVAERAERDVDDQVMRSAFQFLVKGVD